MRWKKILILIIVIVSMMMVYQRYLKLLPVMEAYGQLQIRQFTSAVVIHAKREVFQTSMDEELITVHYLPDGSLESIDYNMILLNQKTDELVSLTESIIREVQLGDYRAKDDSRYEKYLANMSTKDGVLASIPLESLIAFPPVSFLHCRIPVRFQVESNVSGKVLSTVENYGLNNTLIRLDVQVTMYQKMMLPFFHDIQNIEITFPVAMRIVHGDIPEVYVGE